MRSASATLQRDFAAKLRRFGNQIAELGLELFRKIERGIDRIEIPSLDGIRLRPLSSESPAPVPCATLSCSLISASSSASGRGGQPAT